MAKIIDTKVDSRKFNKSSYFLKIVFLGIFLGLAFYGLFFIINKYTSVDIASNVATILIATIGVILMAANRLPRPLLITVSSAVLLWDLAGWLTGLSWLESILYSVLLYVLSYVMFSWFARYSRTVPVLVFTVIAVIIIRIIIIL